MSARIFTTLRVVAGEIVFWPDHVNRLGADADSLLDRVAAAVGDLEDARVRIELRPPHPPRIEARPYAAPREPWRLAPVPVSPAGDGPLLKTTDRRRYEEAREAAGAADDALLVGPGGALLETSIANVFFLFPGGRIATPPARGILPGIARGRLLSLATEAPLTLADAAEAVACVVTNAVFLAHPVASIEGVRGYDSFGLARDLRGIVDRTASRLRIIRR